MFLPKRSRIFESLVKQSSIIKEAAQTFQGLAHNWGQLEDDCAKLEALESQGDELVHAITDDIERTFILPLDKEDIKGLTDLLDDIIDNLEQAANRLNIYKIPNSNDALRDFSTLISQAVEQIHSGILMIREHKLLSKEFPHCYKKLHDLENRGDRLHRKVLENLTEGYPHDIDKKDPLLVINWKEIFQILEDTLDMCEDVAIVLEKLRIKHR